MPKPIYIVLAHYMSAAASEELVKRIDPTGDKFGVLSMRGRDSSANLWKKELDIVEMARTSFLYNKMNVIDNTINTNSTLRRHHLRELRDDYKKIGVYFEDDDAPLFLGTYS